MLAFVRLGCLKYGTKRVEREREREVLPECIVQRYQFSHVCTSQPSLLSLQRYATTSQRPVSHRGSSSARSEKTIRRPHFNGWNRVPARDFAFYKLHLAFFWHLVVSPRSDQVGFIVVELPWKINQHAAEHQMPGSFIPLVLGLIPFWVVV